MTIAEPAPRVERIRGGEGAASRARALFTMMSEVFEEEQGELTEAYVEGLLAREDFWVLAAISGDELVGGLTAHVLPLTRRQSRELFVYDLAVREDQQRRGIGRLLMTTLQQLGAEVGIEVSFVPADDDDAHALDFYAAIGGAPSPCTIFTFEA